MTNNETFYRWTKFKNGVGSVAKVTLDVSKNNSDQNKIVEHYSGQGFTSQGNIEDIPENCYDSWKIAARHGGKLPQKQYGLEVDKCLTLKL
jgi:hypothetical protein